MKPKRTIPKKLGAKKTGDQYVIPGNIIYKQRGTIWHPGANVHMGRDHTIHASVTGYVKYYRDPIRHPRRQFIGVTFNRDDKLPYAPGAPRQRKLGLAAHARKPDTVEADIIGPSHIPRYVVRHESDDVVLDEHGAASDATDTAGHSTTTGRAPSRKAAFQLAYRKSKLDREGKRVLHLQDDYSYRESNWEIGRLVGPAGKVGGTGKGSSRKAVFRNRRGRRIKQLNRFVARRMERQGRAKAHRVLHAQKRAVLFRERAVFAAKERVEREEKDREDREKLAGRAGEAGKERASVETKEQGSKESKE